MANPVLQNDELRAALRSLVDLYIKNAGTKHEFITTITPKHSCDLTFAQRRSDPTWRAFDNARELLGDFDHHKSK